MYQLLSAVEQSAFCAWVRESGSLWAYPGILFLHTVGVATVAGLSAFIDLRLLGCAGQLPVAPLERFFPVIWAGFWLNVASGAILFAADATAKAGSAAFGVKMLLIALGAVTMIRIRRSVFRDPNLAAAVPASGKLLAVASLALWCGAIAVGRLMTYVGSDVRTL